MSGTEIVLYARMKALFTVFIIILASSPLYASERFLLVGNLSGKHSSGYKGFQGAVMEKFETLNDCEIAGEAFIASYKASHMGQLKFGSVSCVNLDGGRPRYLYNKDW